MGTTLPTAEDLVAEAHRDLRARTERLFVEVEQELGARLEQIATYYELDAITQGLVDAGSTPEAIDAQLALMLRERALAEGTHDIMRTMEKGLADLRALAAQPLLRMEPAAQLRYWLTEAMRAPGRREKYEFTPTTSVTISRDFIDAHADYLRAVLTLFVQMYEQTKYTTLLEKGYADPEALIRSRITEEPSWRELCTMPDIPLTESEGLGLVGIGIALQLWSPVPTIDQLEEYSPDELPRADVPFLHPESALTGGV